MSNHVEVAGEDDVLTHAATVLARSLMGIEKLNGRYVLIAPILPTTDTEADLLSKAPGVLAQVNGLLKLGEPDISPLRLIGVFSPKVTGSVTGYMHATTPPVKTWAYGHQEQRDAAGNIVPPPESLPEKVARLAVADPTVAYMIGEMAKPRSWATLFNIFETIGKWCIVVEGTQGRKLKEHASIEAQGLATGYECKSFGTSANNFLASGDAARHGPGGTPLPSGFVVMNLDEGSAFVRELFRRWVDKQP